ncbi:Sec-independent protein translocase protein TatB [Glacieibacterium megasporae]|uniref:Sec-independent protein translocase protein TatB n=1 Tax=Glacieibacterium megasporae TaxID=2835787 RepID=UPI001C1E66F2|nr:Sec-independent protein translocase protein TatB [Polymorphobacter megasporae]UAJ11580.1 Sec-independent protein translocase protein TatB [Polymorphobacter megasporae]
MFGIDSSEFLLIAIVALVVIGPKDLPRVMRMVGGWVGRGRAMTRHLRSGFDTMMREAELEEMQKQWAQQNADIMAATTVAPVAPHVYDAPVVASPAASPVPNIYDMPVATHAPATGIAMTGPRPSPAAILAHADVAEPAIAAEPLPAVHSEPVPPTAAP